MHDKEKKIRTERQMEALRNGYPGLEGKFGTILKYLGHPIISEGGSFYETYANVDYYAPMEDDDDKDMPEFDEEQTVMELGYIFDGLSNGIHIEIKYISEKQELTVLYKGYMVYAETAGELECYVPAKEWESKVELLYTHAKKRENKQRGEFIVENRQEAQREKESLLERLRLRWGL